MLDDAHVVHEREEVVGAHSDALPVDHGDGPPLARRELHRLAEDCRGRRRDGRPGELVADPPRLGSSRRQGLGLLDVVADRTGNRTRIAEGHERAGAGGEHVLGVPVRGRDDAATGGEAEGQRPGRDLLPVTVRGHEHVRRSQEIGDLVDAEEPVVELHVILEAEVDHGTLQREAVALSFTARDIRMRPPRDHVRDLRVALDDRRKRLDHRLEALAGRDQAEGRKLEPLLERVEVATVRAPAGDLGRPARDHPRRPMRHDPDLLPWARSARDQQVARGVGHHDHELRLPADGREDTGLMRRRLGQHGVQGDDERLGQPVRQGRDVLAVAASEDPVLVLEQDDVDIEPTQDPRCAHVVPSDTLRDRGDEPVPLGARRLVDDHDLLDAVDPLDAEERAADVGGERADAAGTRRIGRDDRGAHDEARVPS